MIEHRADWLDREAVADGISQIDQQQAHARRRLCPGIAWRSAAEQQQQVAVLGAADPYFLPAHHIMIAVAARGRGDAGSVGTGARLGHAECLQPQLAAGDRRKVSGLLFRAAMPQHRTHRVHLRVRSAAIAAGSVHFLQHRASGGQAEARPTVFLGDQHGQIAGVGQRPHETGRISAFAVEVAPVFAGKAGDQPADSLADLGVADVGCLFHPVSHKGTSREV